MTKQIIQGPTLRFPEFSTPWVRDQVKNIFDEITRGQVLAVSKMSPVPTPIYIYPVYSSQTVNNGIIGYYNEYLFEDAITWTTDGYAGRVTFRSGKFYSTNVNGVLISHRGYSNKAMAEALNRVAFRYVAKAVIPKLMNNVMEQIVFTYPPDLAEQQKIGNFFKDVDNKITSLQNALSKIKELKQSLIYKLLVVKNGTQPELRFPEFTYPWSENKVENIFDRFISGEIKNVTDLVKDKQTETYKYPVITSQTTNNGICGYSDTYLYSDCITWATHGANAGAVFYREGKFLASELCSMAISDKGYGNFAMAAILNNEAYKHATRAGIPKVSKTTFKQIVIKYPQDLAEQQKLSNLFKDLDNLFSQLELTIEHHKTLKQALLQRMFV
ncbi:hypothetical protein CJP74_01295 [Psittacicella melopsittaci]|uniref:Type I restriction modification DNA specificity domain-containing protein n=1 Tax=Psittacicella melopsittaci TaxID=2028576 RepID=A0A3A1Y5X4_9GAMM|nr:restriction endonuclease subunit S [Psittacicella melopsittaci]RIY33652.1 hypothetical protein CJP74_01295 [Psittacicella melopsittaci]